MASMQVSSNWRTIGQVLTAGFYKVPRFQRAYSWDRANVEDFWQDLIEAKAGYFIGSMVIFTDGDASGLVDGQQRLTTITMLLSAVRNALLDVKATDDANGIQTLIERVDPKGKKRFVLETETSYPYLQGQVQSPPGTGKEVQAARAEERALEQAFSILADRVAGTLQAVDDDPSIAARKRRALKVKRLSALRNAVLALSVVLVEVDDEDDATVIFQTLNSRGKDLENSDLVKSHVFALLRPDNPSFDEVRDEWNAILRSFDESAGDLTMNRFLLHSWLSRHEYVGEKQLFKAIRSDIRASNARDYLEELTTDAYLYRVAQEPSYKSWQKSQRPLRESLEAMVLFRLRQPLPMVLALLRELELRSLKPKVVLTGLRALESYHFVATAVTSQPSSGGVSKMYASSARQLLRAKTPQGKVNAINDLAKKLRDRRPSYAEFEASFLELRSSRAFTQDTPLVRYALRRLHVAASDHADVDELDLDSLTLEHLVPQGSKKPPSLAAADVARIGNLLLVTQGLNEELADKPFSVKQTILQDKSGAEAEVLSAKTWGARQIEEQTKRLARRAYENVWSFSESASGA